MNANEANTGSIHDTSALGTVAKLWRYPVKSMLGEPRDALPLNHRGIEGDRLFAIRDINGKFGSGKSTRRFRMIDGLFRFHAAYKGDMPEIRFPDGQTMRGDDPGIHAALSHALGQPVTLAREAEVSHLDAGPVHLLTTASLAWLKKTVRNAEADARRFRPNVLIEISGETLMEQNWLGRELIIGDNVRLRVSASTERCGMVGFAQADLRYDPRILKCITQEAELHFGVYANILVPGSIQRGDRVAVAK